MSVPHAPRIKRQSLGGVQVPASRQEVMLQSQDDKWQMFPDSVLIISHWAHWDPDCGNVSVCKSQWQDIKAESQLKVSGIWTRHRCQHPDVECWFSFIDDF